MKKLISIMLALVLIASVASIAASAISVTEEGVPTVEEAVKAAGITETRRYYFMMPDGQSGRTDPTTGEVAPSWYNDFAVGAGIYWFGGSAIPSGTAAPGSTDGVWAGYGAMKGDAENVYYADVPVDVTTIVWNNGVDGGMDTTQDIYYKAAQTVNINSEFCDPGEEITLPNGVPEEVGFDNMIYIIYPEEISVNDFSQKQTCGGHWYYYYGNGCYGMVEGGESDVDANCLNPDHHHGSVIVGDADDDGQVTIMDATRIQRYIAELVTADEINLQAAKIIDPDADEPSIMDATRIQRYLAELCNLDGSDYVAPEA